MMQSPLSDSAEEAEVDTEILLLLLVFLITQRRASQEVVLGTDQHSHAGLLRTQAGLSLG